MRASRSIRFLPLRLFLIECASALAAEFPVVREGPAGPSEYSIVCSSRERRWPVSKDNSTGLRYRRGVVRGREAGAFRNELRYGLPPCPEELESMKPLAIGWFSAG